MALEAVRGVASAFILSRPFGVHDSHVILRAE